MLIQKNIENILFLDIETVPAYSDYNDLPERFKSLWDKKTEQLNGNKLDVLSPCKMYERAGIYAEFGKIICISVGFVYKEYRDLKIRIKSFWGDNEKELLISFSELINKEFSERRKFDCMCAHNGKEFDFPYISRRLLINGLDVPDALNSAGKKPWEVNHLDTMELWKFGDFKSYTSLNLLTAVFDIPTPKDDIDGSQVCQVYWFEKNLNRIVEYCQKDVIAIIQVFLRYQGLGLIDEENISYT